MRFDIIITFFEAWVFFICPKTCYEKNVLCVVVCKTFVPFSLLVRRPQSQNKNNNTENKLFTIKQLWSLKSSALGHTNNNVSLKPIFKVRYYFNHFVLFLSLDLDLAYT